MPAAVQNLWQRVSGWVRGFTPAQMTIAIIGLAAVVLGGVALASWLARPTLTPLFSGLSATDASAVVEELQAGGVPYELADGGSTVLVAEGDVYDQRLALASAGLPGDNSQGYNLLDQMGVTASEFQQNVTYQRALEGELAATIAAISGVETATVRLALPEETVFVSEQRDPTASVFVATRSGTTLSGEQVQAIVHLVSAAVQGMSSTDVAVIDADGTVLSTVGGGATGSSGDQASEYETRVAAAVTTMLDRIVGAGNSSVVVSADVAQGVSERTSESYGVPEGAPALTESTDTESYTGEQQGAAGVLGPDNIAVPQAEGNQGEGAYVNESSNRTNAVDRTVETVTTPAGGVERQTVSVALNQAALGGAAVGDIEQLVAAAAGIDPARGDAVAVQVVDFDTTAAEGAEAALAEARAAEQEQQMQALIRTGAIALAVLIGSIVVAIIVARAARRPRREPVDIGELRDQRAELDGQAQWDELIAGPAEPPTVPLTQLQPVEPTSSEIKRAELNALAQRDPAKTADLLRAMMDDGSRV